MKKPGKKSRDSWSLIIGKFAEGVGSFSGNMKRVMRALMVALESHALLLRLLGQ